MYLKRPYILRHSALDHCIFLSLEPDLIKHVLNKALRSLITLKNINSHTIDVLKWAEEGKVEIFP